MTEPSLDEALAALPPGASALPPGTVVSAMRIAEGGPCDLAIVLGEPPVLVARAHPPENLDLWLSLLERRRQQLAHDLSGPATGVLAALETVLEFEPVPESARTLLQEARTGMLRLTRLLEDRASLLTHSPNAVAGPLASMVARSVDAQRTLLDASGERLRVVIEAAVEPVRLDDALLCGALATLLSNGWRFRRGRGANLIVRAERVGDWLQLTVQDDGRGMDEETLRRAGELGFAGRGSGMGMGLFALRKALARTAGAVALNATVQGTTATVFMSLNTPER